MLGYLPVSGWFNGKAWYTTPDYSNFIKMICLNHFIIIFHMSYVDFSSSYFHVETYILLILQLDHTMREDLTDQEWTSPSGLEFTLKQAQSRVE